MEPLDFMDPEPPIEIQIEMSKHKHKFELLTWEPDGCEEGTGAIIGAAKCGCGEQIGPTEIERRINGFAALEGRPSPEMLAIVLKDREIAEGKLETMERIVNAFDIEGLKSWAQAIVDEWKRGERDYSATKVAEKILAGLARGER